MIVLLLVCVYLTVNCYAYNKQVYTSTVYKKGDNMKFNTDDRKGGYKYTYTLPEQLLKRFTFDELRCALHVWENPYPTWKPQRTPLRTNLAPPPTLRCNTAKPRANLIKCIGTVITTLLE